MGVRIFPLIRCATTAPEESRTKTLKTKLKTIVRKKHDLTITRKCENTLRVLAQMYKNQCKHCNPNIMLRKQAYDHITIAMLAAVGSANPKRDVGFGAH